MARSTECRFRNARLNPKVTLSHLCKAEVVLRVGGEETTGARSQRAKIVVLNV